ncbi:MAG TPA: Ada metal-binding domain-containing protein, partial [Gemmatimonadales bacterium]|nr:Ada metal-binding domain-containing protein [Gemmatimonadales bacterium]
MPTTLHTDREVQLPEPDDAWRAVERRDPRFDGRFVYAVRSTRIYCRPSCPSRRPARAHVTFYREPVDAERAGYRACRRCRPREVRFAPPAAVAVEQARQFLEAHPDQL